MSIKTNLLFNMPQDINTLNKLRLNYYSFTLPFDREKAKADFLNFIKNLYSD